jgi:hypothetical protein
MLLRAATVAAKRSAFIVTIESDQADEALLQRLERVGLAVDRAYGLVKLDPTGHRRVARVLATEPEVEALSRELGVTFYPDLEFFRSESGED